MNVQCQSCQANGQVSDEAQQRALLWVCEACGVRHLVTKTGARRAPTPPPPPIRKPPTQVVEPRSSLEMGPAKVPTLSHSIAADPKPPALNGSSPRADGWLAELAEVKAESPAASALSLSDIRGSAYPVMAVPVHDPLWRRPALLASALAGLLVGLAAYGVRWTREQAENYAPNVATATAAAAQQQEIATSSSDPIEMATPESHPGQSSVAIAEGVDRGTSTKTPALADKRSPARREHAIATRQRSSRARTTPAAPESIAAPATALAPSLPSTETTVEQPPKVEGPATFSTAMANALEEPASDQQAKSRPTSNAGAGFDAYTPFSRDAALSALSVAAASITQCRSKEGPFGTARVAVTFAPSGNATMAIVEGPPFAGTPVGSCIARTFREARVSPFSGAPVTVRKSVTLF